MYTVGTETVDDPQTHLLLNRHRLHIAKLFCEKNREKYLESPEELINFTIVATNFRVDEPRSVNLHSNIVLDIVIHLIFSFQRKRKDSLYKCP